MIRGGQAIGGAVLFASWRLGWSIIVWLFVLILVILIIRCIKSLLHSVVDAIEDLLDRRDRPSSPPADSVALPAPRRGDPSRNYLAEASPSRSSVSATTFHPLNTPELPPQYDQVAGKKDCVLEIEEPPPYETLYPPEDTRSQSDHARQADDTRVDTRDSGRHATDTRVERDSR